MENLELFTRRKVHSVSDLLSRLKKLAEKEFSFVWVKGEISGLVKPASGHLYFTLKDQDSALKAVFFRRGAGYLRFKPENGMQVLCQGRISVYQPRGDLQLVVETMEPKGAGSLALEFERIKNKLAAQGLFDQDRKKPLPALVNKVAVVTSSSGAALHDFLKVLHKRFKGIEVAIYPTLVQGDKAAQQMIEALEDLGQWGWPQVIVLTRGGGSPEDLWAYNDEGLAYAIAKCPIPVVSAIGHEIDFTISDMVADYRSPTPTGAAELLAQPMAEMAKLHKGISDRLKLAALRLLETRQLKLKYLRSMLSDPSKSIEDKRLRLDDLYMRALGLLEKKLYKKEKNLFQLSARLKDLKPDKRLALNKASKNELEQRLYTAIKSHILEKRTNLKTLQTGLKALGPQEVLNRGYALVTDEKGKVLRNATPDLINRKIDIRLAKGALKAEIEEIVS